MVLFFFISMQPVNGNECRYETETITENGSIISTKEIKAVSYTHLTLPTNREV